MKIRELTQKAENLIEQGENAKQKQVHYQQQANSARAQVMSAYARLESAASETDEDGNPIGDVSGAQAEVFAAQALLESAESGLAEATQQLEGIGKLKMDAVHEIERYEVAEESNMSKLAELQKKQFGTNANAFIADLAARMNSGEETKQRLLQSLGQSAQAKHYSAGGSMASGISASTGSNGIGADNATANSDYPSSTWMNQFNAYDLKSKLSSEEYKQKLAIYRQGLGKEIGEDRVGRMTDEQIEELSSHRSSYTNAGQAFDAKQFIRDNYLDVISDGNYAEHKDPSEYNPRNRSGLLSALSGTNTENKKLSFEDDNFAANEWFTKRFKPNINESETDALRSYTGTTAFYLNEALYKHKSIDSYHKEIMDSIDGALAKNHLSDDIVVYRCLDEKAIRSTLNDSNIPSLKKDIALSFPAYSSTSVCSNNDYMDKNPHLNYILKLTAKKGTPAIPLENITNVKNEYEVLFGRNSKVFVKNVFKGKRSDLSADLICGDKDVVIIEGIIYQGGKT